LDGARGCARPGERKRMITYSIAKGALWECRRCGAIVTGGALLVMESPEREASGAEVAAMPTLDDTPESATLDERRLRCAACGSREVEIPFEILDGKRLP